MRQSANCAWACRNFRYSGCPRPNLGCPCLLSPACLLGEVAHGINAEVERQTISAGAGYLVDGVVGVVAAGLDAAVAEGDLIDRTERQVMHGIDHRAYARFAGELRVDAADAPGAVVAVAHDHAARRGHLREAAVGGIGVGGGEGDSGRRLLLARQAAERVVAQRGVAGGVGETAHAADCGLLTGGAGTGRVGRSCASCARGTRTSLCVVAEVHVQRGIGVRDVGEAVECVVAVARRHAAREEGSDTLPMMTTAPTPSVPHCGSRVAANRRLLARYHCLTASISMLRVA